MRPRRDSAPPDRIGRDGKLGGLPDRRHPHRFSDESYRAIDLPILATCVAELETPVLTGRVAEKIIDALMAKAERFSVAVHAYCVMPDHIHMVVTTAASGGDFRGFMRAFKSASSRWINRALGLTGRADGFRWQRSYWDTFADDDGTWGDQIDYVLQNPVRDGLCDRSDEWPYVRLISYP